MEKVKVGQGKKDWSDQAVGQAGVLNRMDN